jgi:hypothetical protein
MKKIKGIIIAVVAIVILAGGAFVLYKLGVFGKKDELSIDKTANVVTEIKKISEFTSACYYEEIILQESKASSVVDNSAGKTVAGWFGKDSKDLMSDQLVIVANGTVRAGFRLDQLDEDKITITGDTLSLILPKAEIFDVIVNPSDFDIYIEDGTWDHEKVVEVENRAIDQVKNDAIKEGILEKATETGIKRLTEMFKAFGFSEVMITVE